MRIKYTDFPGTICLRSIMYARVPGLISQPYTSLHTMHLLTMTSKDMYYHDFAYAAHELSAYIMSLGIFIISLRNGRVVNYTPADAEDFDLWLSAHHVRDISKDDGIRPKRQY
jgi:hypothetical protein